MSVPPGEYPIIVEGVTKSYDHVVALDDVTFDVVDGEILGLLGPNGAGKSTLLEAIAGLRKISDGVIRVFGVDPAKDRTTITSSVGVQPQSASLFESLSVTETIRMYASFYPQPRGVADLIAQLGLATQSDVRVKNLSGGQQRRLLIGTVMVGRPKLVVLDEPSAGLDPQAKRELHTLIRDVRDQGTTVLVSTHDMQEATDLCDRVGILAAGRLRAIGAPAELIHEQTADVTVTFLVPAGTDEGELRAHLRTDALTSHRSGSRRAVSVVTSDPDSVIRALTFAPSLHASDYRVERRTLEEAYLALLGSNQMAQDQQDRTGQER